MSFSSDLKIELSKINNLKNKDEVQAEFFGYASTIAGAKGKNKYKFSTYSLLSSLKEQVPICFPPHFS